MFDPRSEIKALFNNSRITGRDKYNNAAYVDIYLREDNSEGVIENHGIILLEPPRAIIKDASISENKVYEEVAFDANLYVIRKQQIKDYDTFINDVIDTLQVTINQNRHNLSCCDDVFISNVLSPPVQREAAKTLFRRVIEIRAWKYKNIE